MSVRTIKALFLSCSLTLAFLSTTGNELILNKGVPVISPATTSTQLRILSWNIGMLPSLNLLSEKNDRAEAIAKALSSEDYDIIVFEEAFIGQARMIIRNTLKDAYPYVYGPVNKSLLSIKVNGGVWILSKIPLIIKKEIEFTSSAGFDSFARKGAILFEGQIKNTLFQLIATHLQDDDYPQDIRNNQLSEIYEKLIVPYSDPHIPQIICGDFNTDEKVTENYTGMLKILDAEDGALSGTNRITFDDQSNDAFHSPHPDPRQIDYILTRNSQVIKWMHRQVSVFKSRWGKGKEYLSDHNAIEAVIEFMKLDYLSEINKSGIK
jgi:endonuclease/exonuclease/phosphatase family metal-dependent hydrolase